MLAEQAGNIKTAEKYLKKTIEIDPEFANAYNSLGYTLLESAPKRRKEAEKYINQAYELDPSNPYIIDSKGWLAFKQKKYLEAEKLLQEALQLSKQPEIYSHLIELFWITNKKNEARDLLSEAEKIWPQNESIELLKAKLKITYEPNK